MEVNVSLDRLRVLMRTYTPGRRVRIKDEVAEARRDRVPLGITEGLILKVVPLPSDISTENIVTEKFGVEIEYESSPGNYDALILGTEDVELEALNIGQLRADLWHRTVNFPRSSGIGIDFPIGSSDYGIIDDATFRKDDVGRITDLVVSLRIAVDPDKNPHGTSVFYVEADFVQCVLLMRKSSG